MIATYQTRIAAYAGLGRVAGDAALDAYGELYGRVQRKLFAAEAAFRSTPSLKSEYLERYGIPARLFNAVRVSLKARLRLSGRARNFELITCSGALAVPKGRLRRPRSVGGWISSTTSAAGWRPWSTN